MIDLKLHWKFFLPLLVSLLLSNTPAFGSCSGLSTPPFSAKIDLNSGARAAFSLLATLSDKHGRMELIVHESDGHEVVIAQATGVVGSPELTYGNFQSASWRIRDFQTRVPRKGCLHFKW